MKTEWTHTIDIVGRRWLVGVGRWSEETTTKTVRCRPTAKRVEIPGRGAFSKATGESTARAGDHGKLYLWRIDLATLRPIGETAAANPLWRFSKPRSLGFTSDGGRTAYEVVFRRERDGVGYIEHLTIFARRPTAAAQRIATDDAPARFAMGRFEDDGTFIGKPAPSGSVIGA